MEGEYDWQGMSSEDGFEFRNLGRSELGDAIPKGLFGRIPNPTCTTPPKTNMEPENDGFQKESPLPGVHFHVPC